MKRFVLFALAAALASLSIAAGVQAGISARHIAQGPSQYVPTWSWDFRGGTLPSGTTFTRASAATYFDASGVLQTAASNVARFDHDPVTHAALGYLAEVQSTNSIRNNTMVGAGAGTPGTLPTNWATVGSLSGLTQTIVGTGSENGISYIDIRLNGTPNATTAYGWSPEPVGSIAASTGQSWSLSVFVKLVGGSLTNAVPAINVIGRSSGGLNLEGLSVNITPISSALGTQRQRNTYLLANASSVSVTGDVRVNYTNGLPIDLTLRIGLPQIEQLAVATSPILTLGSAATRAGDVLSMPLTSLTGWTPSKGGVLVTSYRQPSTPSNASAIAGFNDVTSNNRLLIRASQNAAAFREVAMISAGASQFLLSAGASPPAGVLTKQAFGWSQSGGVSAADAAILQSLSGAYVLPTVTTLNIGHEQGSSQLAGQIAYMAYYAGARSDAFVQQVSHQ